MPAGRPKLEIDAKQVELLASAFCTDKEIAAKLGCSSDTLTRNYADALKKGRESAKCNLRALQWRSANKGSVPMLIWLGKQYLNQRDRLDLNSITPEQALAILREEAGEDSE